MGWTLLELLASLAIIALITSVAAVSLTATTSVKKRLIAGRIRHLTFLLRAETLSSRQQCYFLIDIDNNKLTLEKENQDLIQSYSLPKGFNIESAANAHETIRAGRLRIPMSPWGYFDGWSVIISYPGGKQGRWSCRPPLGELRIKESNKDGFFLSPVATPRRSLEKLR